MAVDLVTGATGAFGVALARRLRDLGRTVRVMARPGPRLDGLRREGFTVAPADLRDPVAVDAAVRGCERVFHVAAHFQGEKEPDTVFFDVNVGGTRNLLSAAQRFGVERFVHTSTVGVHGSVRRIPADETAPLLADDPYRRSKLAGERLALSWADRGLNVSVIRPAAIYGPGDRRFLKLFRAVRDGWFVMLGDGRALYHLVYVDDLVDGALRAASVPEAIGEPFLLAGPRWVPIAELVERIAACLDVPVPRRRLPLAPFRAAAPVVQRVCRALRVEPPLYPRRLEFFTDDRAFDTSKARKLLGFEPRVDLDEGLRRTADAYRERGWL